MGIIQLPARAAVCCALLVSGSIVAAASPLQDGIDAYNRGDIDGSIDILRGASETNDPSAQYAFGMLLTSGDFPPSKATASEGLKWLRAAAENDGLTGKSKSVVAAQLLLGQLYEYGRNPWRNSIAVTPKDPHEAMRWYRKASENGSAEAQDRLASYYWIGDEVPRDLAEAVKWYRKAGEAGYGHAQSLLGVQYAIGDIIPRDFQESFYWLLKAASESQNVHAPLDYLGLLYLKGFGTAQNYTEARHWFEIASKGFSPYAEYALGSMYEKGLGIPVDPNEAFTYYRASAQKRFAPAQYRLALAYLRGERVPVDAVEALKWLTLSVSNFQGMNGLELKALFERDPEFFPLQTDELNPLDYANANTKANELRKVLSQDDIEKAAALLRAFVPVYPPIPIP